MALEVVAPQQKINVSLGDLIKSKQNKNKKTTPKPKQPNQQTKNKVVKVSAKPSPASNGRKNRKGKQSTSTAELVTTAAKLAKSIGASQAKRAATISNRRGLTATAKPMKKTADPQSSSGGLKISFNTKELTQTTDKEVSLQIKAVLGRQSSGPNRSSDFKGKGKNPRVQR
jgi:hypothetical protein